MDFIWTLALAGYIKADTDLHFNQGFVFIESSLDKKL